MLLACESDEKTGVDTRTSPLSYAAVLKLLMQLEIPLTSGILRHAVARTSAADRGRVDATPRVFSVKLQLTAQIPFSTCTERCRLWSEAAK